MRESFVFHEKYIRGVPDGLVGEFCLHIARYGLYGEEPEFTDWRDLKIWADIKERIDTDAESYGQTVVKRRLSYAVSHYKAGKASSEEIALLKSYGYSFSENTFTGAESMNINEHKKNSMNINEHKKNSMNINEHKKNSMNINEHKNGFYEHNNDFYDHKKQPPSNTDTRRDSEFDSDPDSEFDSDPDSVSEFESEYVLQSNAQKNPPPPGDVKDYFKEIGAAEGEAQKFLDYYGANGWQTSKGPVRDWKASARLWNARAPAFGAEAVKDSGKTSGAIPEKWRL